MIKESETSATADSQRDEEPQPVAFFDAQWRTKWIFIALVPLALNRLSSLNDSQWTRDLPSWLVMLFGWSLVLSLFLIPILSRRPNDYRSFHRPSFRRLFRELAIAIPLTLGLLLLVAALSTVIERLSPQVTLTPEVVKDLARTPSSAAIYAYMIFGFTLGPVFEETFFRGFLHNALRTRLPLVIAVVLQSLLFTFGHFYSGAPLILVFTIGLVLTGIYHWRKTLLTPILVHAGINGVTMLTLALSMAAHSDQPVLGVQFDPQSLVVEHVVPGGPADEAGFEVGDRIQAIDQIRVDSIDTLLAWVATSSPGDSLSLTVVRDNEIIVLGLRLGRRGDVFKASP